MSRELQFRLPPRRRGIVSASLALVGIVTSFLPGNVIAQEHREAPSVGMQGTIDQMVLPGSELRVKPNRDDKTPIVLRIAGVFRHGTDYRYDFVYYGLEPGEFDLKDYLERKDGSATDDLTSIPVTITSVLEAGQIEPHPIKTRPFARLGGYRTTMIVLSVIWAVGLVALIVWARGKKAKEAEIREERSLSLADRLRPVIDKALAGDLSKDEQAKLERMLFSVWRRRLGFEDLSLADGLVELRKHEEAGALLRALEQWLHNPKPTEELDLVELLKPYQDLPYEEQEVGK